MPRLTALLSCLLLNACAAAYFGHNLSPAHKVKVGMTTEQAFAVMGGPPLDKQSLQGVDEWRYCASREYSDVFVVLYFQNDAVIEKADYTVITEHRGHATSCRETVKRLYKDRRSPPQRVQELRAANTR